MNGTYILEAGMNISWHNQSYLIRALEPDFIVLENNKGQKMMQKPKELFADYAAGKLKIALKTPPVVYQPLVKKEHIEQAQLMNNYLLALDNETNPRSRTTMKKVISQVADKYDYKGAQIPSDSKLYRWYNEWVENDRNVIPLVVKGIKKRKAQIEECVFDLADQCIWDEYLKINGADKAEVYRVYQKRHQETYPELRSIGKSRFYELFKELCPVEVTIAREGRDAARKFKRIALKKFVAKFMGERAEIDAVHLKVGIYDAATGVYLGCPTVYLAIDVYTRYIIGYSISYSNKGSETAAAVIECLKHVALPKQDKDYLSNSWEYLGIPTYIAGDAGTAFRAKQVISLLATMRCEYNTTETGTPWKKPFVERFNRTLRAQFAKKLDGYIGRRSDGKQYDKTIQQMAKLNDQEFRENLEKYLVDVYHQNPHRGLEGLSPAQAVAAAQRVTCPAIAPDASKLDALGGQELTGKISPHEGLRKNNLHYNSTELRTLYNQLSSYEEKGNPKVSYLYNVQDISKITVINPNTLEILEVPCTHPNVEAGLSLHVYKANKKSIDKRSPCVLTRPSPSLKDKPESSNSEKECGDTGQKTNHTIAIAGSQSASDLEDIVDSQIGRIANDHSEKQQAPKHKAKEPSSNPKKVRKPSKIRQGKKND
ncbi:transposase [Vibrio harveyi]